MTHGSIVCWAAQQTSWDTTLYRNHGAFVSHWAKTGHHGADALVAQVRGVIEFTGVSGAGRRRQPADDVHLVADVQPAQPPLDHQPRPP